MTEDGAALLIAAGWKRRPSGRWAHPHLERFEGQGRVRCFHMEEALTLLAAHVDSQAEVRAASEESP